MVTWALSAHLSNRAAPGWPHHTRGGPAGLQGWAAGLGTGILNIPQRFQAVAGLSIPGRADRASAQPGHIVCNREMTAAAGGIILDLGAFVYGTPY